MDLTLTVRCAGCGADIPAPADQRFVDCDHCGASSVLDLGTAATSCRIERALNLDQVLAQLATPLREAGFDPEASTVGEVEDMLVPFWLLSLGERALHMLAVDDPELSFLGQSRPPAGQLEPFTPDSSQDVRVVDVTVPLPSALARLGPPLDPGQGGATLVYVPFARVNLSLGSSISLVAFVNSFTGEVHLPRIPWVKRDVARDRRLLWIVALTVVAYVGAAWFVPGGAWTTVAYLALTAPLYYLLRWAMTAHDPDAGAGQAGATK